MLGLCGQVGLASVGMVAIDGTKMSANASMNANRDFLQIARAILREAVETDQREDEFSERRTGRPRSRAARVAKRSMQRCAAAHWS